MIVSETRKFIFIHNPKAGGMTFRTALKKHDTTGRFFLGWIPYPAAGRTLDRAHLTLAQLREFHGDVFDMLEEAFTFGFVRDPYQRFCSAFAQHLKLTTPLMRDAVMGDPDCFYTVLNQLSKWAFDEELLDMEVKRVHFRRQSDYFYLDGARLIDVVSKVESPDDWDPRVVELLGGRDPERRNITQGDAVRAGGARYDVTRLERATLDRINAFYAPDFERFGYEVI